MPINELLPEDPQYEYSSPLSLLPVRRKVAIPYAPEYWQNELALPGLARTVMNDMWLALTAPGRAVMGEFTPEEMEEVGLRAGFGIADLGVGAPLMRPGSSFGMFGWGKKPPAKSATPAADKLLDVTTAATNELGAIADYAAKVAPKAKMPAEDFMALHEELVAHGLSADPINKKVYGPSGVPLSGDEPWLTSKEAAAVKKGLKYVGAVETDVPSSKSGMEALAEADYPAPTDDGVNPGLEAFNKAYAAAKEYLGASESIGISAHPDTGEWSWVSLKTGEPITMKGKDYEGSQMARLMENVNKAASDYAASFNPKHPSKKAAAAVADDEPGPSGATWWAEMTNLINAAKASGYDVEFNNGDLPLHSGTSFTLKHPSGAEANLNLLPPKLAMKLDTMAALTAKLPELTSAKKMDHFFGKQSALGKQTVLTQTDSFYPDEYSSWDLQTASGLFKMLDYKKPYSTGGATLKLMAPNEDIYDFASAKEAEKFIQEWLDIGHKPWSKTPAQKGTGGSKLLGGQGPSKPGTLSFKPKPIFTEGLEKMPPEKMREYSPSELDWEYNVEYEKYAKSLFPDAFASRADFQRQYDAAPLRHLTDKELKNLEYATLSGVMPLRGTPEGEAFVQQAVGHRRDVGKIMEAIRSGQTTPPIVLRHDEGLRLLGGNTRLMSSIALGRNMPVKVIDIRSFPRRGSHPFDPAPPLTPAQRAENFKRWFAGSRVVDDEGEPLVMYHSSPSHSIEAFDPEAIRKKSGGARDFTSLTSSPQFASNWNSAEGKAIYPVYVSAKNPGDFRNPNHVEQAAIWKALDELRQMKPSLQGKSIDEVKKAIAAEPLRYEGDYLKALKDYRSRAASGIWTFWEDPKMWREMGWDGAFMKEDASESSPLNFAAPKPSQIKSVFNKGWWSESDPRILYSAGLPVPLDVEPVDYDPFALEPVAGNPFEQDEEGNAR